ncbi:MAG: universal stress protein [Solirubrobacterales bacterium]|nr:universal stress protein [Solirubrobacterales bacterium]
MLRNVLLVLEPSHHAERALTEAIDLAEGAGGRLTILIPVPDASRWTGSAEAYVARQQLADELDREVHALQESALARVPGDLPVVTVATHRRIGPALLAELATGCHDVIVIGGRPHGVLWTALFGGVSARTLRRTGLPVLTVRRDDEPPASRLRPRRAARSGRSPDADRRPGADAPRRGSPASATRAPARPRGSGPRGHGA